MAIISMSTLATKYKDFMVPALKVKSGGFDIIGQSDYAVESVEVTLSQSAASAAVIKLTNVYDLEDRSFVDDVTSDFILGELLDIEMGYGSSLTSLFYGYVDEITYELSENPSVRVTAVDVRRMMMGSKKSNISHQVKSYSDAFQEVVKKYKPAYKMTDVDATNKLEGECIIQNGSDYDFIKEELCRRGSYTLKIFLRSCFIRWKWSGQKILFLSRGELLSRTPSLKSWGRIRTRRKKWRLR